MMKALSKVGIVSIVLNVVLFFLLIQLQQNASFDPNMDRVGMYLIHHWVFDPSISLILRYIIVFIIAIFLNIIANSENISLHSSLMTSFFYLLFMLLSGKDAIYLWEYMAQLILLLLCYIIAQDQKEGLSNSAIFYSSILIGILVLLLPSFIFLAPIFMVIVTMRTYFDFRKLLFVLLGLSLPLIYFFSYLYLTDSVEIWKTTLPDTHIDYSGLDYHSFIIIALLIVFYLILASSLGNFNINYKLSDQNVRQALMLLQFGVFLATMASLQFYFSYWTFTGPSMALLLTGYYSREQKGMSLVYLIIFVILCILINFI